MSYDAVRCVQCLREEVTDRPAFGGILPGWSFLNMVVAIEPSENVLWRSAQAVLCPQCSERLAIMVGDEPVRFSMGQQVREQRAPVVTPPRGRGQA